MEKTYALHIYHTSAFINDEYDLSITVIQKLVALSVCADAVVLILDAKRWRMAEEAG